MNSPKMDEFPEARVQFMMNLTNPVKVIGLQVTVEGNVVGIMSMTTLREALDRIGYKVVKKKGER